MLLYGLRLSFASLLGLHVSNFCGALWVHRFGWDRVAGYWVIPHQLAFPLVSGNGTPVPVGDDCRLSHSFAPIAGPLGDIFIVAAGGLISADPASCVVRLWIGSRVRQGALRVIPRALCTLPRPRFVFGITSAAALCLLTRLLGKTRCFSLAMVLVRLASAGTLGAAFFTFDGILARLRYTHEL